MHGSLSRIARWTSSFCARLLLRARDEDVEFVEDMGAAVILSQLDVMSIKSGG